MCASLQNPATRRDQFPSKLVNDTYMRHIAFLAILLLPASSFAQDAAKTEPADVGAQPAEKKYTVTAGTRIPLSLINSVSTKSASEGDRIYLESVFPIVLDGKVVIPPGSYVAGTVTSVKRPGRVKGRGELYVRFDSLTLPNGVTRDFRARVGALDGRASEDLDKEEGRIRSEGNKGGDLRTIGEAAAAGASVGAIAGSVAGRPGMGVGIGAGAAATAALIGVFLSRGPEAVLAKGTTLEMVIDRPLYFAESEIDNSTMSNRTRAIGDGPGPLPSQKQQSVPMPGRRLPI